MKKELILGSLGLLVLGPAAPVIAADLAARPYPNQFPGVAANYDWSGFYIGLNGGGGSSRECWDLTNNLGVLSVPPVSEGCHHATGGTVGGQIGYRWESSTSWVFGLEAQGNWADFSGSNNNLFFAATQDTSRIDGLGLFTGQVGYAWNNALFYVKGGAAITRDQNTTFNIPSGLVIDSSRENRWGSAVGTGLEFSFASNWSVAVEYDHMFMGARDVSSHGVGNFSVPEGAFSATDRIHQDVDFATVRLNYRWGGPVVSTY